MFLFLCRSSVLFDGGIELDVGEPPSLLVNFKFQRTRPSDTQARDLAKRKLNVAVRYSLA